MRAVDTSVLIRLLVSDDPRQFLAAQQVLSSQPVFISKTVIVELEWVLRGVYAFSRAHIAAAIDRLAAASNVEMEAPDAILQALRWFRGGMDLADAVHLASSAHTDAFVTFDVAMGRRAARLGAKPAVVPP